MRKLKSIAQFKNETLNLSELSLTNGGIGQPVNDYNSARVENLEIATLKEQVNKLQIERDILLMAIGK